MVLYPSKEWLEEYGRRLNQSKEYKEAGKGWGVGWNGDFIFQIENIPINSISIEDLPADLAKELREYVIDGTGLFSIFEDFFAISGKIFVIKSNLSRVFFRLTSLCI